MEKLEERTNSLITDDLVKVYLDGVDYFNTKDLVLVFDENKVEDPVDIFIREALISQPNVPDFLKEKLSKPAHQAIGMLTSSEISFWFIVFFSDDETTCTAVKLKLMAQGGTA